MLHLIETPVTFDSFSFDMHNYKSCYFKDIESLSDRDPKNVLSSIN